MAEFAIDNGQVGTLVGLFMLPGLVFALPGGLLGKRFGDRRIVMMGMAAMILGGVLSGVAQSYALISVGRLISGVGGVFLAVLMAKMVTDWFAGKELFLGMSIFIIGWPVGIAAAACDIGTSVSIGNAFHCAVNAKRCDLTLAAFVEFDAQNLTIEYHRRRCNHVVARNERALAGERRRRNQSDAGG